MDKKTKEEIRQQLTQLQFETKNLGAQLDELATAVDGPTWEGVWQAVHRQGATLRRLVPGVMALGQRMVKLALAARVTKDSPAGLADLTRTLLTKYLNIHGGAYEAVYAQLARGAAQPPDAVERISASDPEMVDVAARIGAELDALQAQAGPAAVRLVEAIELSAAALQLICDDTPANRASFGTALGVVLDHHLPDASTALELLNGG